MHIDPLRTLYGRCSKYLERVHEDIANNHFDLFIYSASCTILYITNLNNDIIIHRDCEGGIMKEVKEVISYYTINM